VFVFAFINLLLTNYLIQKAKGKKENKTKKFLFMAEHSGWHIIQKWNDPSATKLSTGPLPSNNIESIWTFNIIASENTDTRIPFITDYFPPSHDLCS